MPSRNCGKQGAPCCSTPSFHHDDVKSSPSSRSSCNNVNVQHDATNEEVKEQFEFTEPFTSVLDCCSTQSTDDDDPWLYRESRLQALNFPLGGFGTGNILLQGDGSLQGWTIQNQFHNPEYTPLHNLPGNSFAISAAFDDDENVQRESYLLQSAENYTMENQKQHFREERRVSQHQVNRIVQQQKQLPSVPKLEMKCQYPMATVRYHTSSTFPLEVEMQALTPLIPSNIRDSSYPLAVFTFRLTNRSADRSVSVDLMQSTMNFIGWDGHTDCCSGETPFWGQNINAPFVDNDAGCAGVFLTSQRDIPELHRQGSLALVAMDYYGPSASSRRTSANDGVSRTVRVVSGVTSEEELFLRFTKQEFEDPSGAPPTSPSEDGSSYMCGVVHSITSIPPNATVSCRFVLSWYFPNRPCSSPRSNLPKDIWGNHYANWFSDARDVIKQFCAVSEDLIDMTHAYVNVLYGSTIPWEILESAAGRVACVRSPTMFWTKDDVILGNEGNECCPLNCSHVYGYTTLLERLFPSVAKNMRISDFVRNFDPNNGCTMRFGQGGFAIDGSLANVIKTYLVVQQSDPTLEFLKSVWPNVKIQVDIVFSQFLDKDGAVRVAQQNTYDSAMHGANTFIGSYVVTAFKAAAGMAGLMGDIDYAEKCRTQAEVTAAKYEELCWRDEFGYYIADVDDTNCENSYGPGCFIDQLCAIGLSLACGFGTIFDPGHEAIARKSILQNNKVMKPPFQDQQHHFYNGDAGIRVCTYPNGKLGHGMPYTQLVSSGFTYPVVAGMIYDGNLTDAREICRMIRARQSGIHRSPWNEPECGLYYARSMAAWNLYDQACGFCYDSTKAMIGFAPKMNPSAFSCFCVFHQGFGQFEQSGDHDLAMGTARLRVLYGTLDELSSMHLQSTAHVVEVTLDGQTIQASIDVGGIVKFDKISMSSGSTLEIHLSSPCSVSSGQRATSLKNDAGRRERPWRQLMQCLMVLGILWLGIVFVPFSVWINFW